MEFARPHLSEFILLSKNPLSLLPTERAPSDVHVGGEKSDSISFKDHVVKTGSEFVMSSYLKIPGFDRPLWVFKTSQNFLSGEHMLYWWSCSRRKRGLDSLSHL